MLMDSQDNLVPNNLQFTFDLDNNGNPIPVENPYSPECGMYSELIFEIDMERLLEYTLVGFFWITDRLQFNWNVTFEVERNEAQIIADGLSIPYEDAIITEIRVSPSLIHVKIEGDFGYNHTGVLPPEMVIHTENGSVHPVQNGAINSPVGDGTVSVNFFYDVENPLDMSTISSIEIMGNKVTLH